MRKILIIFLLFAIIPLSSCGYKIINKNSSNDYFVEEIKISGDKRIGYILKNEIILNSKKSAENRINVNLKIDKKKKIKEKNISNKITKYTVSLNIILSFKKNNETEIVNTAFKRSVDYDVVTNHSDTLNNERKSQKILTDQIAKDILNYLNLYFN